LPGEEGKGRLSRDNLNVAGLLIAQRQAVATQAELDGVAQRRPPEDLDAGAVAEAHLQQPAADFRIAADGDHAAAAADAKLVQAASADVAAVVTPCRVASFLHRLLLPITQRSDDSEYYTLVETEFQQRLH